MQIRKQILMKQREEGKPGYELFGEVYKSVKEINFNKFHISGTTVTMEWKISKSMKSENALKGTSLLHDR